MIVPQWMQFLPAISRQRLSIWPQKVTSTDRSPGPTQFLETNIVGTYRLLEGTQKSYHATLGPDVRSRFRFVHVSTDEVYGIASELRGAFARIDLMSPKLALFGRARPHPITGLAHAWYKTYGLPVIVSNCSNILRAVPVPREAYPARLTIWLNALDKANRCLCTAQAPTSGDWLACRRSCAGTNYAARAWRAG